jgi:hypothetical protein
MNAINVQPIETALLTAKANGLKWPKLRAGNFVFSLASQTSRNYGSIYVKSKNDVYLGKITNGMFYAAGCTPATIAALIEVANTLNDSVIAYGKKTGSCGCCGRTLTDPVSVAAGIGPVCAENFGFSYLRDAAAEELEAAKAAEEKKGDDLLDSIL